MASMRPSRTDTSETFDERLRSEPWASRRRSDLGELAGRERREQHQDERRPQQ